MHGTMTKYPKPKTVSAAFKEYSERVWYVRHTTRLNKDGPQSLAPDVLSQASRNAARIEKKYGKNNLMPANDFELGLLNGRYSALQWLHGMEWCESLDT